jgi:uncharacterized protein (TIGR03084 family)
MFSQVIDFRDESMALYELLRPLDAEAFGSKTQFKQWTFNDIIGHLHMWNWAADLSLNDEAAFQVFINRVLSHVAGDGLRQFETQWLAGLAGPELLETWYEFAVRMSDHFGVADPSQRVKWAGPDMSVRSAITARLMETWAHGQAIYDVLGVERRDEDRIRNIAVLGVKGDTANQWMSVAQCFAGPPEQPPLPGTRFCS